MLRAAGKFLAAGAGGRRLVLAVDDAHLLDASSATLLHHLAVTESAFLVVPPRRKFGEFLPEAEEVLETVQWWP